MTGQGQLGSLTLGIVGLGLIGASIAAGLKKRFAHIHITGCDQSTDILLQAQQLQLIDAGYQNPAELCQHCELIVLAVPVLSTQPVLAALAPALQKNPTALTDVGSVKGVVADAAQQVFGHMPSWFIPGHPIAGSEFSGLSAADPDLFCQHAVILTPDQHSSTQTLELLYELWQALGAQVTTMPIQHHDEVLAGTSHLPHLLSYALVDCLANGSDQYEMFEYAAGGFRDFTRIAASDPDMWHDISLSNAEAILTVLERYQRQLESVKTAIQQRDGVTLKAMFQRAKRGRDYVAEQLSKRRGHFK